MCEAALAEPGRGIHSHQSDSLTPTKQHSISHQSERIYLSSAGELLGAHVIIAGTTLFVDTTGQISLATRDYTAELDYDYTRKLNRIGNAEIVYDYTGRIERIGSTSVAYGYRGQIAQIGNASIEYTPRGKVAEIGDVTVRYARNLIDTISSNYTSAGARIVVVSQSRRLRNG